MQFRLSTLFLLFVVLWASLAKFQTFAGFVVFALLVGSAVCIGRRWRISAALMIGSLLFLILLLLPAMVVVRLGNNKMACVNSMKQIGLAIHNYRQHYGVFPPACVYGKDGRPMHSWRLLILPFLGYDSLYGRYNMNEPWDSPNNSRLLNECPQAYKSPGDFGVRSSGPATEYLAVVGPDPGWPLGLPGGVADPAALAKAASKIMVIETKESGIAWTEPKDLPIDGRCVPSGDGFGLVINSPHMFADNYLVHETPRGAHVMTVNGNVWYLSNPNLIPDRFQWLFAKGLSDQNRIDDNGDLPPRTHWPHCATLIVWLLSVGWLFYRAFRSRKWSGELAAAMTVGETEAPMNADESRSD
ncbi:MAG: DUF1559 domain-containing protein [Thermoguttaceae bacterium]